MLWLYADPTPPDTHAAFRAHFNLTQASTIELRLLGASWYHAWVDGDFVSEGPPRFPLDHPEYTIHALELGAGEHVLAVQVHYFGIETRLMADVQPFVWAEVHAEGVALPLTWRCAPLPGYHPQASRVNAELGWVEWCDTRLNPADWQQPAFDDAAWSAPVAVERPIGVAQPLVADNTRALQVSPHLIAEGPLAHIFGYEFDDVSARFYLRDLECRIHPPRGLWRRYDLGRVRLCRPQFTLDVPAGTQIEFAHAESLYEGRVAPWISLSGIGGSANLDHFVARGGPQTFGPLSPKGGRFLEMHVLLPPGHAPEEIHVVRELAIERAYYEDPIGSFTCDDPLLSRIWNVGVETLRACAEDAIIDNPTRERGQWTGDVVAVGLEIAAMAFADLRIFRRALIHCAQCAREDGMIAGLTPGHLQYLNTYSLQWVRACITYYEQTSDRSLLEQLYGAAWRNFEAFDYFMTDDGLVDRQEDGQPGIGWTFVDWGYKWAQGPSDMALNLHALSSHRALARWCKLLGHDADSQRATAAAERLRASVVRWFDTMLAPTGGGWESIGYHVAVLALGAGIFAAGSESEREAIAHVKAHMLNCFPNNPNAPRNDDPQAFNSQLITPYFAHYAMPPLIERGEMDFVLGQYRKCWGEYGLAEGRTTWVEVFDTRWSHCHQWSGCPTWQLSRYALGLQPRHDLGGLTWVVDPRPGSLNHCSAQVPLPNTGMTMEVFWERSGDEARYRVRTPTPVSLLVAGERLRVEQEASFSVPLNRRQVALV